MTQRDAMRCVVLCLFLFGVPQQGSAVVFGKNSRRSVEEFAAQEKLNAAQLRSRFAGAGLVECGEAHGAGQLTLANDVITTAAHVFFDEKGTPRAKTCYFAMERYGKDIRVPIDLRSIVAGSKDPYAIAAVHDWAVAKLTRPVEDVVPFSLADGAKPEEPIEFVARGHIDWGDGRKMSMEKCHLRDQLSVGTEGTREFSFDCETGDGASGGALVMAPEKPVIGAILVGWRSNKPFRSAPFSKYHYNFAVTIEGAFRTAVVAAASKVVVAK
ncbi:MAG TPA: trypsin-like serine protease [Methylocella sp.]|nr:trypsin-like serine protease [Methylocella sp.]